MIELTCSEDCNANIVVLESNRPIICWNCGREWKPTITSELKTKQPIINLMPTAPVVKDYKPLPPTIIPTTVEVATGEVSIDPK